MKSCLKTISLAVSQISQRQWQRLSKLGEFPSCLPGLSVLLRTLQSEAILTCLEMVGLQRLGHAHGPQKVGQRREVFAIGLSLVSNQNSAGGWRGSSEGLVRFPAHEAVVTVLGIPCHPLASVGSRHTHSIQTYMQSKTLMPQTKVNKPQKNKVEQQRSPLWVSKSLRLQMLCPGHRL